MTCEMCAPAWHNHGSHFCFVTTVKEPQGNDTPSLEVYSSIIINISWGIILKIQNTNNKTNQVIKMRFLAGGNYYSSTRDKGTYLY